MKKIIILYALILLYCTKVNAQDIKWVYEFKGTNNLSIAKNTYKPPIIDNKGNSFVLLRIEDTLLINNQTIINEKKTCLVLVALDSNGVFKWTYTMKAGDQLTIKDMITTSDGSVVLIGNYNSELKLSGGVKLDSLWYNNGFMIKIGANGNLIWSKNHKYAYGAEAKIASDKNGNLYVHLFKSTLGAIVNDTALQKQQGVAIAKFDKSGVFIKMNTNTSIYTRIGNIAVSPDGNHLYIFNTLEPKENIQFGSFTLKDSTLKPIERDFYVACANSALDFVFLKRFSAKATYGIDELFYKSLCVDSKENLYFSHIFVGKLNIAGNNYNTIQHFPIWIKIDTIGNIVWAVTTKDSTGLAGGSSNMGTTKDGNVYSCLIASGTYQIGALNVSKTAYLNIYFDNNGYIYAAREFWGSPQHRINGLFASDGENTYVLQIYDSVLFNQKYYGNGADKMVFVKLANPNYNINLSKIQSTKNFVIFPNPTCGSFTIAYNTLTPQKLPMSIYNTIGEQVYNTTWNNETSKTLDLSYLAKGIYFLRVGEETQRVVIE